MSESNLWAEGIGPEAAPVALCRLVDVIGHCAKQQPFAPAVRHVIAVLSEREDVVLYVDDRPGEFARPVTTSDVWVPGQDAQPARTRVTDNRMNRDGSMNRAYLRGFESDEKVERLPAVAAVAEQRGRSGIFEVLAAFIARPAGLDALPKLRAGRLVVGNIAMRARDALALFGYGQADAGKAPANVVAMEAVPTPQELAQRAKDLALEALKNPPQDLKARNAWAAARAAELNAVGIKGVRGLIAQACGEKTARSVSNWLGAAEKDETEAKKVAALASGLRSLTGEGS